MTKKSNSEFHYLANPRVFQLMHRSQIQRNYRNNKHIFHSNFVEKNNPTIFELHKSVVKAHLTIDV